jgi:hypothetical protein
VNRRLAPEVQVARTRSQRTIDKARRGGLPTPVAGKVWFGPGSARECHGCGERVAAHETEVETDLATAVTFRFHGECYRAWLAFNARPPR